jgi:DNA repair exonuclease SbcCD ATPase subunit
MEINVDTLDSEKQLATLRIRLVELEQQRDQARQGVESARNDLIEGKGTTEALTGLQSTYSAICEAVAELERRVLKAARARDEADRQAKRAKVLAKVQEIAQQERDDESALRGAIERVYSTLEVETAAISKVLCDSAGRQDAFASLRRALDGEVPAGAEMLTEPHRNAALLGLCEADPARARLFAGSVRTAIDNVLFEQRKVL